MVRIVERRPPQRGARPRIDAELAKIEVTDVRIARFIRQLESDFRRASARIGKTLRPYQTHKTQQIALAEIEIAVDRVDRLDDGEDRLFDLHEVADIDQMAADAAGHRRLDVGVAEIEFRLPYRRFGGVQ